MMGIWNTVELMEEDGRIVATWSGPQNISEFGETEADALRHLADAVELYQDEGDSR
jgi:predicted RNase H-like HicB family nuclease